jgi:hypothetical protein
MCYFQGGEIDRGWPSTHPSLVLSRDSAGLLEGSLSGREQGALLAVFAGPLTVLYSDTRLLLGPALAFWGTSVEMAE